MSGNRVRAKNSIINKVYEEGREINRKQEIKNGNQKFIFQIQKQNDILHEKEEIIAEIQNFYQNLYTSQNIDDNDIDNYLNDFEPINIDKFENDCLGSEITDEEIRNAIFTLNKDKSPGQDGITSEFYQQFWPKLTHILNEVYTEILQNGELSPTMKNGLITLIYKKKGDPSILKFWRPITLLTVDYKILSKILTTRFSKHMNDLLNPYQSSGPKERDIIDNILNIQTILEYAEQNQESLALISLDNEKAFDRMEQNFVYKALEKYNLHPNFIKWSKLLYKNITSQVIVNGKLTPKFIIERSVRQGCPISMLFFVLAAEPLISKINNNQLIKGIKLPNLNKPIKTIQHADDLTAIITSNQSYPELHKEIITYNNVAGSKVNTDKTEILKKGNFDYIEDQYVKNNIKLLGCIYKDGKDINYKPKLIKLKNKIADWKYVQLNIFDKVTAIKTYFIGLFQYQLRAFKMSKIMMKNINFALFTFLWSSLREKIARRILIQDRQNGGLGMIDLNLRFEANILRHIKEMDNKSKQPWSALYVYWFGFYLQLLYPKYAKNTYAHTLDIPSNFMYIVDIIISQSLEYGQHQVKMYIQYY